ncbi:Uncharacterised protein [Actinobacillus pleuropneumoniae]|nr:hypothetical protein AP5651_03061 [Actinobacillus pleuropneumoniae]KIE95500.1 hypothetical protein AP780_02994 [Actinobacillus pleuropneumoniae]CUU53180.1 hypothetical protein MIDG2331_01951 [Actinobacillus pleuropneumoniae serovar 8]SUU53650.1 Uncharacterised protein [Actinobacillus pleuropneumoniae]
MLWLILKKSNLALIVLESMGDWKSQQFNDTFNKFNEIKDTGPITSSTLMSMLPELGKLTTRKLPSWWGTVPQREHHWLCFSG